MAVSVAGQRGSDTVGTIKASVRYGGWVGTAAADDLNRLGGLRNYMQDVGLLKDGEFLVNICLTVGENHPGKLGAVSVSALAIDLKGRSLADALSVNDPLPVRKFDFNFTVEDFVMLFKESSVSLTVPRHGLEGRQYQAL